MPQPSTKEREICNTKAKLAKPLSGYSLDEVQEMAAKYARDKGMAEYEEEFRKGGMLAQNPMAFDTLPLLTNEDRKVLEREITHKWSHPATLYHMVIMCSVAAAVQGMDESVINGGSCPYNTHFEYPLTLIIANLYFFDQFGIQDREWIKGLVNAAPYLCCCTIGCWLTHPMNKLFGRRNTIFVTCFISFAACLWQAFTNTWWHLFIARFCLGFGIGPKSSTVPVYAAECSPPRVRLSPYALTQV